MRVIYNKREQVAIFSGKCFMLHDIVLESLMPDDVLEDTIASMFEQSLFILGIQ